jgi:hypothetical protein
VRTHCVRACGQSMVSIRGRQAQAGTGRRRQAYDSLGELAQQAAGRAWALVAAAAVTLRHVCHCRHAVHARPAQVQPAACHRASHARCQGRVMPGARCQGRVMPGARCQGRVMAAFFRPTCTNQATADAGSPTGCTWPASHQHCSSPWPRPAPVVCINSMRQQLHHARAVLSPASSAASPQGQQRRAGRALLMAAQPDGCQVAGGGRGRGAQQVQQRQLLADDDGGVAGAQQGHLRVEQQRAEVLGHWAARAAVPGINARGVV